MNPDVIQAGALAMIQIVCPYCGVYLDAIQDLDCARTWYEKKHPDLQVGSPVAEPCKLCATDYAVGDVIVIRGYSTVEWTVRGFVDDHEGPPLVSADSPVQPIRYFAKSQICPVPVSPSGFIEPPELIDKMCRDFASFLRGPLQYRNAPIELFRPPIIETFVGIPEKEDLIAAYKSTETCEKLAMNLNHWFSRRDVTRFIAKRLLGLAISNVYGIDELLATGCFE